jgi:hypothetical protein
MMSGRAWRDHPSGRTIGTGAVSWRAPWSPGRRSYAIVVGNPARVIRHRFSPAVAQRLQRLAWWNWDHDRLRAALPDFRGQSVEGFLDKYEPASVLRDRATRQSTYGPNRRAASIRNRGK